MIRWSLGAETTRDAGTGRSGGADLGQRIKVPRVRHRTHRGASDPIPKEVCRLSFAPNARTEPTVVRPVPYPERYESLPSHRTRSGWVTGPTVGASGVWQVKVQLAINGAPDALRSASGATLSASGAPVFWGIRVAGPWTWWEYLYFSTSSMGGLLPIWLAEKHLVVQERSKSLERIENWVIYWVNPPLVSSKSSSVHPPLSRALFGSSESYLLVTLGDHHHLDGLVVIGGTKTAQSSCGWLVSSLWAVLGDSPRWSVRISP